MGQPENQTTRKPDNQNLVQVSVETRFPLLDLPVSIFLGASKERLIDMLLPPLTKVMTALGECRNGILSHLPTSA